MWWLTSRLFRVRIFNGRGGGYFNICALDCWDNSPGSIPGIPRGHRAMFNKIRLGWFLRFRIHKNTWIQNISKHGSKSIKEKWIMILRIRPFSCKYFMKKRWHKTDVKRMMKKLNLCINKSILLYRRISMARIQKITSNPPRWISNPNLESWSQGLDHFSGASRRYKA